MICVFVLMRSVRSEDVTKKPIVIVANRLHPQARSENALELLSELDLPVCPIVIRERAIHRHLLVEGRTCMDKSPDGVAATELKKVWSWLNQQLVAHRN